MCVCAWDMNWFTIERFKSHLHWPCRCTSGRKYWNWLHWAAQCGGGAWAENSHQAGTFVNYITLLTFQQRCFIRLLSYISWHQHIQTLSSTFSISFPLCKHDCSLARFIGSLPRCQASRPFAAKDELLRPVPGPAERAERAKLGDQGKPAQRLARYSSI